MRSIKFRVWNNRKKEWIHGPGEECNLFGECILFGEFMNVSLNELNDCVALQYTGVIDKNGKEIYEGDILASRGNYITDECDKDGNFQDLFCVVVWNTKMSRFGLTSVDDYKSYKDDDISRCWACSITTFKEVIGNIFENDLPTNIRNNNEKEKTEEDLGLESCEQCGEEAWDGYICHACGLKEI